MSPQLDSSPPPLGLDSLYDLVVSGGPVMVPIGLCSIVALAYAVERWLRLRPRRLGDARLGNEVVRAVEASGPARALDLCDESATPLARVLSAGLRRWHAPHAELEKAVEDAGARETRLLAAKLKPLVVIAVIAPLLGLLGTVWGIIVAFSSIALSDGLGKPEALAGGIAQALVTTAAGLVIAIPSQAAYYFLRSRVDRFVNGVETVWERLADAHGAARAPELSGGSHAHP